MDRFPYKDGREALDAMAKHNVPPNRKFIIGWVKYGTKRKPDCSAKGNGTLYFQNVDQLLRIYHRRPHIVAVVVYQRLDVVEANGKSFLPDTRQEFVDRRRRHYPKHSI